ncbi:MAG: hypothetical protein H0V65_08125 [Chitinophagales bacterium]|nr:hypothetical protein [Chitinophagales bacterium]
MNEVIPLAKNNIVEQELLKIKTELKDKPYQYLLSKHLPFLYHLLLSNSPSSLTGCKSPCIIYTSMFPYSSTSLKEDTVRSLVIILPLPDLFTTNVTGCIKQTRN